MLVPPVSTLDYAQLLAQLGAVRTRFDVDHLSECASTNSELLLRAARGAPSGSVLVCDKQTAGRGRRGRHWISAPGHSLTFSVLWRLPPGSPSAALSLAVGLAVAQGLESLAVPGVGLKWPNDIWLFGRKLGGVLIEVASDTAGLSLIIGIGINLKHSEVWCDEIQQAFASLDESGLDLSRETVLGAILTQLAITLDNFATLGFSALQQAWADRNALFGLPVCIESENGTHHGLCGHADASGALELLTDCGMRLLINGGDVSLRPVITTEPAPCTY